LIVEVEADADPSMGESESEWWWFPLVVVLDDEACCLADRVAFSAISAALADARSVSRSICGASPFWLALSRLRMSLA